MARSLDILDERDPLTVPFIGSLLLHGCLAASLFMSWFWLNGKRDALGDPHPGGGPSYAVSPVHSIPIPQKQAPPNPVAHDTESIVPSAPAEKEIPKKAPPEPPVKDAFQIQDKLKPQKEPPHPKQTYTVPAPPNQVYSRTQQAVSNPMYAAPAGSGQVGIGPNTVLGSRLGWYAQMIRDRLAQNWQTNGLSGRLQNAPAVISFHILRDGSIRDPRVVQTSGNLEIDNTALRAVYASNPLNPLPPQVAENDIVAEFTFNLR